MEIKIVATTGRARGQAVEVRSAKFFIGRHENCQVRPDIADLAGIHALIEQRDLRVYLRDFGAEGGTGINDRVLHARETEVFDGDLIQVGPMVLTLSIKPKSEDRLHGLAHAPVGWPFLDESDAQPAAAVVAEAVVPAPHYAPAPDRAPARSESFLIVHPSIRLDPIAPATAPAPAAPAAVPVAASLAPGRPTTPSTVRPIASKVAGRRAISCDLVEDVMVVKLLSADLNEEETVSPFRHELRTLLDEDRVATRMVIDMGHTRYLSSRAVGVLLAHYQGLERKGSTMRVCGVSREIKPVLDQMRLSMLIDIYPTVDEAVRTPWE